MKFRIIVAISFFSLIVSTSCRTEDVETIITRFLIESVGNFSSWIQENNLDPSPPNSNFVDLSLDSSNNFTLTLTIKDEQVVGFSNAFNSMPSDYNTRIDIQREYIEIAFSSERLLTFQGNYSANGTLITGVPLFGEGKWVLLSHLYTFHHFSYNLRITLDGHIDLTEGPSSHSITPTQPAMHFDGLLDNGAGGHANEILEQLQSKYLSRIDDWFPEHPSSSLMHQYLMEPFKENSIADIVANTNIRTNQ